MTIYDVIRALISGGFTSEEAKAEALTAVDTWERPAQSSPSTPPANPIAATPSASFTTTTEPPAAPVPPPPLIPNGEANPDAEDVAEGPEPTP